MSLTQHTAIPIPEQGENLFSWDRKTSKLSSRTPLYFLQLITFHFLLQLWSPNTTFCRPFTKTRPTRTLSSTISIVHTRNVRELAWRSAPLHQRFAIIVKYLGDLKKSPPRTQSWKGNWLTKQNNGIDDNNINVTDKREATMIIHFYQPP
jgi:hypothetical protein